MSTMALPEHPGNFAVVFLMVWFTSSCMCGAESTCDRWTSMARMMTGNGNLQTCLSNKTKICNRLDCEGSLTENHLPQRFTVDYCFGAKLNPCLQPLSMDFYLRLPSYNFTKQVRIAHDDTVNLTALQIPQLKMIGLMPYLDFQFERSGEENVLMSVTLKIRSSLLPIYMQGHKLEIIKKEEIPAQCSGRPKMDTSGKPASDFLSVPCHAQKYDDKLKPKIIRPTISVKASTTYNQSCSLSKPCSDGETCEMISDEEGVCQCDPDYHYMADKNACVSQGSVRKVCLTRSDCGLYEECEKDAASGQFWCQCEESYSWDKKRELCILDKDRATTQAPAVSTESSQSSTTVQPEAGAKTHESSSADSKYIIIGGVAAGGVVILIVIVGCLLYCRLRRRNRFSGGGRGLYGSDSPMLADNDDDDVDLVM